MKKFKFSLKRILAFKETLLDKEKLTLAALRAQLAQIETEIENVNGQVAGLEADKQGKTQTGTTVFELKKLEFQIESSRAILKDLFIKKDIKQIEIDQQLKVVIDVKAEVSGLEKLNEKQLEEYNYALAKESAEEIGELISGKIARESSQ